jgi:hypothetical protein
MTKDEMLAGVARVLVTGSRKGTSRDDVRRRLDEVRAELPPQTLMVVVHGDAEGADRYAKEWALEHPEGVLEEPHPVTGADYDAHGAIAPILRNVEMVRLGADVCLAFVARCGCRKRATPHGTHGSVHCATAAGDAGIPVRPFRQGE